MTTIQIRTISATQTYPVRHVELRKGKPVDTCRFDGDELPTTQHYGYFLGNALVGVVSVYHAGTDLLTTGNQLQVRGMAVLSEHQKKGIGAALMNHLENQVRDALPIGIWFNARESAITFYEMLGYQIIGAPFEIGDIGTHLVMHKLL